MIHEIMFFSKIWFVKTSTRIMKYESRVVKSNPERKRLYRLRDRVLQLRYITISLVWLEMTFFSKIASHKIEKHSKFSQSIWYFDKVKSFWKFMIWFCYYCKKNCSLFWVQLMGTPFLHKLGQKMVIFSGFSNFFSELQYFNLGLLILLDILHGECILKQKVVVVQTPE